MNLLTPQSIAAMYTPKKAKPPQWFSQMYGNAFPEMTAAPELWISCVSLVPFWEGGGKPHDLLTNSTYRVPGDGWSKNKKGHKASYSANTDGLTIDHDFDISDGFVAIVWSTNTDLSTDSGIFGAVNSADDASFQCWYDAGNNQIGVAAQTVGSGFVDVNFGGTNSTGVNHEIVIDFDGSTIKVWQNRSVIIDASMSFDSTTYTPFYLAGSTFDSKTSAIREIAFGALYDKSVFNNKMVTDPLAMLRPALV